ncbi:MAG: tetratricopeptide repeat protein [Nitrospira sp.]
MSHMRFATVRELAHKMKRSADEAPPRFAFFLGAGASRQSGIITASEMIRFFRERILDQGCPRTDASEEEKDKWLENQDWYKAQGTVYSKMFEKYEPKELGRQRYIETLIEEKRPSFGYIVLASLMANNYVRSVLTTNFDDLIYAACTSYSSIRPIVYAYGVLASEMRITASRPKILKLHGDYLYSTLKNTDVETAVQDPNMARQVAQVLSEYGLVVAGYSGNDVSVMRILSSISEKNDLYWCVRRSEKPNTEVQKLLHDKGGFLVEIEGFDEMMNEVRNIVELDARSMIESISERQNSMIEDLRRLEPKYSTKILGEIVTVLKDQASELKEQRKKVEALDLFNKAYVETERGNFSQAEHFYREALRVNGEDFWAHDHLGALLVKMKNYAEAEKHLRKAIELDHFNENPAPYIRLAWISRDQKKYSQAVKIMTEAVQLFPEDVPCANALGWLYLLSNDLKRARKQFEIAISLSAQEPTAVFNLGIVHWLDNKKVEARKLWAKGLNILLGDEPDVKIFRSVYSIAVTDGESGLPTLQSVLHEEKNLNADHLRSPLEDAEVLLKSKSPPQGIKQAATLLKSTIARLSKVHK